MRRTGRGALKRSGMNAPEPPRGGRTVLLVVEYDGASLVGYQRQREGPSAQSLLEEACRRVAGVAPRLVASGRTDRGVHAGGLLVKATFRRLNVPLDRLPAALSAHLPAEVAVIAAFEAPADFHPRRDVLRKTYRYRLLERPIRSPLERARAWQLAYRLDLVAMRRAARWLVGCHDFAAFATDAASKEDTVRTVSRVLVRRCGDIIEIDVEGGGFLYNMVRAIVGSLVEVGRGRRPAEWLRGVLDGRDRRAAGPTAPPHGLMLLNVQPDLRR